MTKTFSVISLGPRGVGKTVFLASNCAEVLRSGQRKNHAQNFWFECLDQEFQEKIEKFVGYVVKTGQYPPPTFKISDFGFRLQHKTFAGTSTLCHLRWTDLPGEWCDVQNEAFQSVLLQSHGCCVFVDAQALLQSESYLETLEPVINQLEAIASLVNQHGLQYAFALICTKCDLVDMSPIGLVQLEAKLMPLIQRLESVKARYRRFYSAIPVINQANGKVLKVKDVTVPLLWLTSEFQKLQGADVDTTLGGALNQVLSSSVNGTDYEPSQQSQPAGLNAFNWRALGTRKIALFAVLTCAVLAGVAVAVTSNLWRSTPTALTAEQRLRADEVQLQKNPSDREMLSKVVDGYVELGQYDKAISLMQQSLKDSPTDVNLLTELAFLYASTSQPDQEEKVYDEILRLQPNNILTLTSKAKLRRQQGDLKGANALFERAEKSAPTPVIKETIRKIRNSSSNP
ncbi:MAG TPA: tetratricopeptide repeat protein [Stenomitos sp.]